MTSSGANTWSIPLELNNLETQIGSGSSGVQAITAGANITITGTASNPIISTTEGGVNSITAGAGVVISGTATNPIITATGIQTLSAGSGISLTSGTSPTISATGVQSISAGTNTTITGTATNPIINLTPSTLPAGVSLNINNADFVVPVAQLANCYLYSGATLTAPRTISFPSYNALLTQYGANAVIPFFVGNFRQPSPAEAIALAVVGDNVPSNVFFNQSVASGSWVVSAPVPSSGSFVLDWKAFWRGTCVLDSTLGDAYYTFTWLSTVS